MYMCIHMCCNASRNLTLLLKAIILKFCSGGGSVRAGARPEGCEHGDLRAPEVRVYTECLQRQLTRCLAVALALGLQGG